MRIKIPVKYISPVHLIITFLSHLSLISLYLLAVTGKDSLLVLTAIQ